MSKRKAFLDSVDPERTEDFLNFIKLHKNGAEPFDLAEVLVELQKAEREELWAKLVQLLRHTIASCPTEHWNNGLDEDSGDEMEVEVPSDVKQAMSVIEGVTLVATVSIDSVQDNDTYTSLLQCAAMLNDIVNLLPASEVLLRQAVHWLFECWWGRGLQGKEELGWTVFIACLEDMVTLKKPLTQLQSGYKVREVLLSVDFESEEGQRATNVLLQCFLNVPLIKREEGKRFLAFLFGWDVNFIRMIHGTIKNQLQFFPKAVMADVAEIYFRAWKKASGTFLEEIESTCIQDLMQHAVLLHRNSPVLPKVRQILRYFHKQKFRQGIDEMLDKLYKPILWKALKAANAEVRANATLLLSEAFPLHDPSMSSDKIDEAVQKQLDTLFALLGDPQPLVRSTAVLAVCTILAKCWEVIPSTIITDFLKKLMTQLATDTSSPDVRCSVFTCIPLILENSMSHPLLEKLLPALKTSLHDTSEKVRVAFVDMLLKIKAARAAKFWKVCSMEHLLARLEVDAPSVSKRIVNLLFNSFFPVNQSEEVWCERCVTLIQMSPQAARKFYQYAYLYTAPTNIAKLMLMIRKCLNVCIQNSRDDPNETGSSNKENTSVLEDVLSVKDTLAMASLLEIVVILWRSIRKSLEHNEEAMQYTVVKFSSVLPDYLRVFQEERCTAPLILLASLLPPATVPTFSCGVLPRLKKLNPGCPVAHYSQIVECLCGWGQAGHIVELITDWLAEALPKTTNKEDTSRKVRIHETAEAKPDLGLDYLEYLLTKPRTRDSVLGLPLAQLKQLHKALADWKSALYSSLSESRSEVSVSTTETALRAFTMHGRLSVHLHHKHPEGRDFLVSLEHSGAWVMERVLPFLVAPDNDNSVSEQQVTVARRIVEICLSVYKDVVRVALGDEEFKGQVLELCSSVLLSEKGYVCIPLLLSVLTEVTQDSSHSAQGLDEQTSVIQAVIINIFQKVLEVLARRLRKDRDEGQELCDSSKGALSDFLLVAEEWGAVSAEVTSGIFSSLFAAVIVEISYTLQKLSHVEEVMSPESVADLPPLSSAILSVLLNSPPVTRSFLSEVSSSVDSEAIDNIVGLAAITHILAIASQTGKFKVELKGIAVSVQKQLQNHYSIMAEESLNVQRAIYESMVRTLNSILMP
ncbi:condensin-2 complex subunit G2 [Chanos chanos]|uniref:Condensin-2 complex subunit G2 n=1 Tax=Chanos chanos TaxID=29144 RepID=A0A6J2VSU5_CHACN|nr:condensin-2 complex subunit G2 [Chanos chanos]